MDYHKDMENKGTQMKYYGNGIMASNDWLASIGQSLRAQEAAQEQWRQDVRAGRVPAPAVGEWGTWSISDRD